MSDEKVFAYVLLSADLDKELESELDRYYWGGIVEAFIDCEEQGIDTEGIWPFGWGTLMTRPSVVQIVQNQDPRDWISDLISQDLIQPCKVKDYDDGFILVYKRTEARINSLAVTDHDDQYFNRFIHLLKLVAASKYKHVVFIGGRGFSADLEIDAAEQQFLEELGIEITNRMPIGAGDLARKQRTRL